MASALLLAVAASEIGAAGPVKANPPTLAYVTAGELREMLDSQQGQVVLVNFWATWCRPCLKEIPELQALAARYAEQDFVLVPVSLDEPDTAAEVVPPFLARWFPDFQSWLSAEAEMDTMVSVIDTAWNEVLPTSYIIGRDGEVRVRLQGGKSAEEFDAAIHAALAP